MSKTQNKWSKMECIKQKIELIKQYDNQLTEYLKHLTKDIVEGHRQEINEWMEQTTHKKNIALYSIGISPEEIWNRNSDKNTLEMNV